MIDLLSIAALAALLFVQLIVIMLCFAYLLDYFVRLATNERFEVISKAKKGKK